MASVFLDGLRGFVGLEIPVLITSGDPALQERMVEVGCPFLVKPFGISQLVAETPQLLDAASQRMADLAASLDRMLNTRRELAFMIEQTRRLVEESRRFRAERSKAGSAASSSRAALFDGLLGEAIAATHADMGTLQVVDPTTNTLRIVASRGFGATFLAFFAVVGQSGNRVISTHWAHISLPTDGELARLDEIVHRAAKGIDPLCGRSPLHDDMA